MSRNVLTARSWLASMQAGLAADLILAYRYRVYSWAGVDSACTVAARLLGADSARFHHVGGVAIAAAEAAAAVPPEDVELLIAAAWLHDIGYSEAIAETGFHPLDGARYLRRIGAPERLCRLVANHTASQVEAGARGLAAELLAEFPAESSATADALTYADLITGPTGQEVSAVERLAEILVRYPPDHVVHQSIVRATPDLLDTVAGVEARLAVNATVVSMNWSGNLGEGLDPVEDDRSEDPVRAQPGAPQR